MPRLLAAEYVYSGAMDDCYNDYVTAAATTQTPLIPPIIQQQQLITPLQEHHTHLNLSNTMAADTSTNSQNPTGNLILAAANNNTQQQSKLEEQQIHSISSSDADEDLVIEQNTIEEQITNISSDDSGDFEGFDDYTTPNSSGFINDASQEDLNNSSNYLKRHLHIDFNEYREDSEGVVEAIEVEDDDEDEEIAIGDDGQIIYRTRDETTPKKLQTYRCEPHTPNKRKKQEQENYLNAISPTLLKTPPDQIVEINSDSTTNSLKQKRQQINTKLQLNLSQQQNHRSQNNPNKCSTESTSEFPVSSPSNPQQPRGGKYPPRPPLLKNTLPADSFERQLAMITACNPQMTLAEKIQSWVCNEDLSDVEDVNRFDEDFKRLEKQKKMEMKQREKSGCLKNAKSKCYDFYTFRQMILRNMNEQKNRKFNPSNQAAGFSGVTGGKCLESSGSESSKSAIHVDDRPTTSAVAQQQLQQRRSKPQLNLDTGEPKKRLVKDISKRNQNSTTPPQTSSSDNERECFQNSKTATPQSHNKHNSRQHQQQQQQQNKLFCPSSSEEAISQDVPTHVLLKTNNKFCALGKKSTPNKTLQPPSKVTNTNETNNTLTKNPRILTDEEIDSVFRLHRLNRERDKYNESPPNAIDEQQHTSIIQMRLDFADEHKSEILMEKKQELFKTPIIPQKYLANPHADNLRHNNVAPFKPATNEELNLQTPATNSPKTEIKNEIASDNVIIQTSNTDNNEDLDGVYHQQHEFCNYLGLTGMSTATAMANAVAELAQCNLARRSMRVLRQQQQERRDKSAKEEKQLEALKHKQLKELRKRERGGSDGAPTTLETDTVIVKSDEGSHSQSSEPSATPKEPKKKTSNNSNTKSSTKSQNSITVIKREPEIKILCHITAKNKEEAEKLSKECIKEITQPIRETLMRQVKLRTTDKCEENDQEKEKNLENLRESVQIKKEEKTDCIEDENAREVEIHRRTLKSPRLLRNKTPIKLTRSRSQIQNDTKETVQNLTTTTSPICKNESEEDTVSEIKSLDKKSVSPVAAFENWNKQNSLDEELSLVKPDIHAIALTPSSIIQQKLQMALEESRKSKPSIFIVQSLECKKDAENNIKTKKHIEQQTANNNVLKKSLKSVSKFNRNDLKKAYKNHKGKKYPTCKRQLRNRKIIVIKTTKPKQKSLETLKDIKRELRSSPRIMGNQQKLLEEPNKKLHSKQNNQETKSYRNVHTETKDLENYLDQHKTQTKTRLMAKASALLERSRRMTLRGSGSSANSTNIRTKLIPKIQKSKLSLHKTRTQILKPRVINSNRKFNTTSTKSLNTTVVQQKTTLPINIQHPTLPNLADNETVVVSSTTNNYDERPSSHDPLLNIQSPITLGSLHNSASYVIATTPIQTKDQSTQFNSSNTGIQYLNVLPSATQTMRNPLKLEYGSVLYIYHEVDILIVIQERLVSFWKCSKLLNILSLLPATKTGCNQQTQHHQQSEFIELQKQLIGENCCNNLKQPASSSSPLLEANVGGEWILLGELRRLNYDSEISVPYANRICLHNSTPIYLEMRAKQLPKNQRDCNLLSMYINIYYYHDEDMIAKCNSIALDSIQSDINSVNYTTLIDSRYFIMTWPQENLLGKTRSGLCKYSLTPQLDTLASIREFKSMRHNIRYLECMSDDKLIGFGDTQVTIWDHRSGDVLMNFDLEITLGKHLGSIYFSSHDIEQNNMLILHQYRCDIENNIMPQLITLACTVTHNQPSYRVLQEVQLPMPAFKTIQSAINSGDHLVVSGENNHELWISTTNPKLLTLIETTTTTTTGDSKRFYSRDRTQLIEINDKTLSVNTITNRIMQLATTATSTAVYDGKNLVWH